MNVTRPIRSMTPEVRRELLGPAEGQYVTFQGTLANANPRTNGLPCYDIYDFTLNQKLDEVCVELTLTEPLDGFEAGIRVFSWDAAMCDWMDDTALITPGGTTVQQCFSFIPDGTYSIYVHGYELTPPVPYTLTITSSAPLSNAAQVEDEACGAQPSCEM